jgi:hypothetical protein
MQLTAGVSGVGVFPASARILFELLGLLLADPQFVLHIQPPCLSVSYARCYGYGYGCFTDPRFVPCANGWCPRILIRNVQVFSEIGIAR